jgi:hypothetical protein
MEDEWVWIWKEAGMACSEVLSWHLPKESNKNQEDA